MTTSITLRGTKGSALTYVEVDDNFSNLKTTADAAKTTADAAAVAGAVTSSGLTMATGRLLGRSSASTGAVQEIIVGAGLALSGGQLEANLGAYLTSADAAATYQPITSMSAYLTSATAASTYQTQAGMSAYLTTTTAASTYQTQAGMSSYLTTADAGTTYLTQTNAASTYQTQSGMSSYLTTATASSTYLTQTNAASTYQTQSGMSSYLTTASAASTYQTQSGMSSYLTTTAAASTYLALSGGTLTGTLSTKSVDVTTNFYGSITAVSASAIDCSLGNYFTKTASGALTWTITNVPATRAFSFILRLTNGGTGTQTWPASVKWPAGTAPTLTASGVDVLGFITEDGGTTWRGVALMTDSK